MFVNEQMYQLLNLPQVAHDVLFLESLHFSQVEFLLVVHQGDQSKIIKYKSISAHYVVDQIRC